MTLNLNLNDNAQWYVKAAIRRGVAHLEDAVEQAKKAKLENPDNGTIQEMCDGLISYNEQMVHEMKQYIPKELLDL